MLSRLIAVWIIVLAASPFTQPFSTVTFDWLYGDSDRTHTTLPPHRSSSVGTVQLNHVPSNPPVEVRQHTSQSHRHVSLALSGLPVENASNVVPGWHRLVDAAERESRVACPFAVLRL